MQSNFVGEGISPSSSGSGRGIGGSSISSQIDNASSQNSVPSRPSTPRKPVSQPRQPAAKPRPATPKVRPQPRPIAPQPQPQPRPVPPKSRPQPRPIAPRPKSQPIAPKIPVPSSLPETLPIESVPAYLGPSGPRQTAVPVAPVQPVAPAVQPIEPIFDEPAPTFAQTPVRQTPSVNPIITETYNEDPVSNDVGTGINSDYDNAEEEGYNYRVPPIEQQLIIERPKKRKPTVRPSPTPRNDEFLDIEAPLPIYGAPPEPFDGGSSSFSTDILTPPEEEEEEALPGYLPPDPRVGRQNRNGRRGRRFKGFSKRFL